MEPAKQSINAVQECDFTFTYIERKSHGVIVGYQFVITNKKYIGSTSAEVKKLEDKTEDELFPKVKFFLETSGISLTDEQTLKVCEQANRCGKNAMDMMQIIVEFRKRLDDVSHDPVEDNVRYLCSMIKLSAHVEQTQTKKDKFNGFQQNTYDFADLEEKILDN